jgi:glycolate oxidase iron-sulfur subunit
MNWLRLGRGAKLLNKIPGLPLMLSRAMEMLPGSQGRFLAERLPRINLKSSSKETAWYFMSCGMNYLRPEAGEATLRVLRAGDFQVKVSENACCGLPAYAAGDLETAKAAAAQNLSLFSKHEGLIVTDCASCSSFLKHYPELLGEKAEAFAGRVQDFTEFVFSHWEACYQSKTKRARLGRVTYHEPCHLSRYQNLRSEPRVLLQSLPGVEYRELGEADWCCGGAGSYALRNPELSLKILERKMQNVVETQADILVTACPSCLLQLESGVKRAKLSVKVRHISQLLVEGLQETED